MSFTELMGSSRGPGVIGMFFAVVVLAGFGLLYTLVYDESGGGKSLTAIIRDNESRIASDRQALESNQELLGRSGEFREIESKLSEAETKITFLRTRLSARESELDRLQEEAVVSKERFEDYKNEYRAFVRSNAEGTKLDLLETNEGETYHDVSIRNVTAIGIDIRHRDGLKRITFEDLPAEMQDYYQFDPAQKEAEVAREAKVRNKHHQAVAAADARREENMDIRRAEEAARAAEQRQALIAGKQSRISTLAGEIVQLESEIAAANAAADSARAAGRMHLNRSGPLKNRIASKQAEGRRLEGEIADLRSQP